MFNKCGGKHLFFIDFPSKTTAIMAEIIIVTPRFARREELFELPMAMVQILPLQIANINVSPRR